MLRILKLWKEAFSGEGLIDGSDDIGERDHSNDVITILDVDPMKAFLIEQLHHLGQRVGGTTGHQFESVLMLDVSVADKIHKFTDRTLKHLKVILKESQQIRGTEIADDSATFFDSNTRHTSSVHETECIDCQLLRIDRIENDIVIDIGQTTNLELDDLFFGDFFEFRVIGDLSRDEFDAIRLGIDVEWLIVVLLVNDQDAV